MNCPACKRPLREKNVGEFTVDLCYGGCGGIWFDANELDRVSLRAAGSLHRVWQYPQRVTKSDAPRACPRCPSQPLDRKWFSDARQVEIDQCPKCNGMWLDDGEFTAIYDVIKKGDAGSSPWSAAIAEAVAFVQSNSGTTGESPDA